KAKKPMIYVGGGAVFSDAADEIRELAEMTQLPVTMTLMGLGSFPGTQPMLLGMLGMHGGYWTNMAMHHADLLIAVGARFDDRVTGKLSEFCPEARVIHIDIDPTSIKKTFHANVPIVGDVRAVLRQMNVMLRSMDGNQGEMKGLRGPWLKQVAEWKRSHPLTYRQDDKINKPQFVIEKLYELTKHEAIVATDVGQHQMWAAQYFKGTKPRTWLTSGGLGTMGFGFPAAIGAQKAFPDKMVVCITSEGSFQMNLQELATAAEHKLPIKIVLLNNRCHGMVRQWQDLFYEGRYSASQLGKIPDFVKLAEAYGILGLRAAKPAEVEAVLKEGLKHKGPVLMDIETDPYENCYPMIPAGGAHHEMMLEDPPELNRAKKGGAQKSKVVEVLKVVDLTETDFLDRETALIKVHTKPEHRDEAIRITDIFRAKIVDSSPTTYTIEITGNVDKVEALINLLKPLGIKELIRTGRIAIARETTRTASPRREPALLKT